MNKNNGFEEAKVIESLLPNSKKTYVSGKLHPDIRVPFREISLAPTKTMSGKIEVNEPVWVYDTSGPWGDPDFHGDVTQGVPPLRARWMSERGDVEEYDGRKVQPIDDGWLSDAHASHASRKRPTSNAQRRILRAATIRTTIRRWAFGLRRSPFHENRFAVRAVIP